MAASQGGENINKRIKKMKIAIHQREGTFSSSKYSFNRRWIAYCEKKNINYKLVDAFQNDVMQQISDCDAFMWHFYQNSPQDFLFATQVIQAIAASGKIVFPSVEMTWHFDDKVAQKYLLEGIRAPLVDSKVFYFKKDALKWAEDTEIPVVFKLRGGSGSQNVKLLRTKNEIIKFINKAFSRGFSQYDSVSILKDRVQKFTKGKDTLKGVFHGLIRLAYPIEYAKVRGRDSGYIYFQKFIPNNDSDTRVIIVGNRAFGIKRPVRENDFRASGGGFILYDKNEIDKRAIKVSFEIAKKLNFDCVAFDYIFDKKNNPLIVEISFGFAVEAYDACPGYWDEKLNWNKGKFIPQEWMVEDLILDIQNRL